MSIHNIQGITLSQSNASNQRNLVTFLQTTLALLGYRQSTITWNDRQTTVNLIPDGVFGPITIGCLNAYKEKNKLPTDGRADQAVWNAISKDFDVLNVGAVYQGLDWIHQPTYKGANIDTVVLHHTAGPSDAYAVRNFFNSRQGVATMFIVGGDGTIVQTMPNFDHWAEHLNMRAMRQWNISREQEINMAKRTVGIEICNWGALTERDGKFYSWTNIEIPSSEVVELNWRGVRYFHRYTQEAIDATKRLLVALQSYLQTDYNLPKEIDRSWFEYDERAARGDVRLFSHSSVRAKTDISPQQEIISMLESLA